MADNLLSCQSYMLYRTEGSSIISSELLVNLTEIIDLVDLVVS